MLRLRAAFCSKNQPVCQILNGPHLKLSQMKSNQKMFAEISWSLRVRKNMRWTEITWATYSFQAPQYHQLPEAQHIPQRVYAGWNV